MTSPFDANYSTDVSLSRILDVMIDDNESPSTILAFLDLHIDDIEPILANSSSSPKLFQLDFVLRCDNESRDKLMQIMNSLNRRHQKSIIAHLCWQILRIKNEDVKHHHAILPMITWARQHIFNTSIRHPYRYGLGRVIESFDEEILSYCLNSRIEQICNWTLDETRKYFMNIQHSLFIYRMCQYDVFNVLSPEKKYIMLKSLAADSINCLDTLYVQILDSDESIDVKLAVLDALKHYDYDYSEKSFMHEILNCKTFSQISMKAIIAGEFDMRRIAFELLHNERYGILHEWVEHDSENLNQNLNISDLVEHKFIRCNAK